MTSAERGKNSTVLGAVSTVELSYHPFSSIPVTG